MNRKNIIKGRGRKEKGESSIEYLMTHGWALVVILVVVTAFYFLDVFNPATYVKSQCTGFSYFSYIDQKLTPGQYTIHVRGKIRNTMIKGLQFDDAGADMNPIVNFDNANDEFIITGSNVPSDLAPNNAFTNIKVKIIYDAVDGIQNNTDEGLCNGKVVNDEWTIDIGNIGLE